MQDKPATTLGRRMMRHAALLAGVLVAAHAPTGEAAASTPPAAPTVAAARPVRAEAVSDEEHKWGIEAVGPALSAGGYALDFRLRVIDPEKAQPLLQKGVARYVVHTRTGATLGVFSAPKVGSLRQTAPVAEKGRMYFTMFANPGAIVKAGDEVTVVVGDMKLKRTVAR
jgi:hypothetical protein